MKLKKLMHILMIALLTGVFAIPAMSGPAMAADDIKIGTLFVMTGKLGGYGKSGWQAVQLAVDEINASGGIMGRKVVAFNEDTKAKPEIGVQITKKYILKEKVNFILGPTASSVGLAVSDVCRQYKKIMVSTQSATDVMTGPQYHRYVFQVLSNALQHARSGASLMADLPYKKVDGPGSGLQLWSLLLGQLQKQNKRAAPGRGNRGSPVSQADDRGLHPLHQQDHRGQA